MNSTSSSKAPAADATSSLPTRRLGRADFEITTLTFGCWQAGGGNSWTDTNDADSLAAMRAAFEAGIAFFDTAPAYGKGHSEELVGRFAHEVGHGELLVATKVSDADLAPEKLRAACDASLSRLGIERIDLYQIHWPAGTWGSAQVPIGETVGALLELRDAGKIRAIGVSNFSQAQIEQALSYGRIDALQPPYSLFFTPYEQNGTIEFCRQNEIAVIPYSPLAQGLVTGKFTLENRPSDNRSANALFKDPVYGLALKAVDELRPIAQRYGVATGPLALAWLIAQPGVTSPIVGARTPQQIRETARAAHLEITPEDLQTITSIAAPVVQALPIDRTNPWRGA